MKKATESANFTSSDRVSCSRTLQPPGEERTKEMPTESGNFLERRQSQPAPVQRRSQLSGSIRHGNVKEAMDTHPMKDGGR